LSDPIIDIDGLTKIYRSGLRRRPVYAVKNLALTVPRGSIVAFVGPNGAGKTTTIHTLLGFLKPNSGRVRVFGQAPGADARRKIGYQSEIFHTYPFYKPRDVLRFYGQLSGMSKADVDAAAPALLERVGLGEVRSRAVGTFSKGMTQRLGLAQALLHDPELLILDEPTSGLDPEGRRLVLDIIRDEKRRGRTVFLSSHILADVERTCDTVVMIRRGEVAFADAVSAFSAGGHEWEIEEAGWTPAVRAALGEHAFEIAREAGGTAVLVCATAAKKALLRALTATDAEIVAVQPRRGATLEDRYLAHLEEA
jgi:ABC-2 type transport system ATP-binding protein